MRPSYCGSHIQFVDCREVEFGTLRSDASAKERRFHKMKVEWGFDKFMSHKEFKDGSNGYLVDDTCVFGAEVFVCKERNTGKGECLTMMKIASANKHTWKVDSFSQLSKEPYDSQLFNAGNYQWKMTLHPKGKGVALESHISLYLALADPESLSPGSKIYATVILRILDQWQGNHYFGQGQL